MKDMKLERSLSPISVFSLALGCIIGWGAFVMPGNTFLVKAGPLGTAIAMCIAAMIMMIIAYNYQYMINITPVAGGEFEYARIAFGEKHAFLCSWFLGLSYLAIVPLNATALALIGRCLFDNIFQTGFKYKVAGYDVYCGEILLAISALIFFAFLSIKGVKIIGQFQTLFAILIICCVLIVIVGTMISSGFKFSNLYPLFNPNVDELSGILAVIAVAPWAFVGFDTIPQAAEEFNFSHKKSIILMIISITFGAFVYVGLNTVTAIVIPNNYGSWVEYINDLKNLNGLVALPTFHASYKVLGMYGLIFLGMAVTAAILSGIIGFYMASSRLLFSMSREKMLPDWFSRINTKYKTPHNAILFVLLCSIIAPFFGRNALGWIVDMSSIGAAIGYGYTSAAAMKYAITNKNYLVVVTGAIGIVMAFVFTILLLFPIPIFNCSLCKESYLCLLIWCLMGYVFYKNSKDAFRKVEKN